VFVVDGNQYLNRPGPRLIDSAEILAEIIHGKHNERKFFEDVWIVTNS
jgi:iron complex transport system substrate-binding protein|tara:strand:+ start:3188 stop:3331 length:144 start_codon:yes stop_codon:yes gene_type:complete